MVAQPQQHATRTTATEPRTVPAHPIPTNKGKYRHSLGDGAADDLERGVYRTAKNERDEWYWYPVAPLPHVSERIARRGGDGAVQRMDYRVAMSPGMHSLIVTDEQVTRGEWANRLGVAIPADLDITRATATAIRLIAHEAPLHESCARWQQDGTLTLPPADLLPAGYADPPADDADAAGALHEACRIGARNPKVALMFGAAFGGIYLRTLERPSFWTLAVGESSRGKTSALTASAALLGDPGDPMTDPRVVRPWNFSAIGLTQWLGELGCLPVFLDELGTARFSSRDWETAVMRTVEGSSRTVGGKYGDPRTSAGWRGVLLTTGNEPIVSRSVNEAVAARVIEIPTPIVDGRDDAERLTDLAPRYRGYPFRRVLDDPQLERMRGYLREAELLTEDHGGVGRRLARHLALCIAGARMLGEMAGVPELQWAAAGAAEDMLAGALAELAERGADPGQRLAEAVEQAVATRPAAFPSPETYRLGIMGDSRLPHEVEGLILEETERHTDVAVFTGSLDRIAQDAGTANPMTGLRKLRDRGELVTAGETDGRLSKRIRAGNGLARVYVFRLAHDGDGNLTDAATTEPVPDWEAAPRPADDDRHNRPENTGTQEIPGQAIPEPAVCRVCGETLHTFLVDAGERTHPSCEPEPESSASTESANRGRKQQGSRIDTQRAAVTAAREALETNAEPEKLRILAALEGDRKGPGPYAPRRRGRGGRLNGPFWRPELPGIIDAVHVVTGWQWDRAYSGRVAVLDRSGAWVAAAASVEIAHGAYEHTAAIDLGTDRTPPGHYLVTVYQWREPELPSPLGAAEVGSQVWVPAPTLKLLRDLEAAGRWPDAAPLDSYTGDPARLDQWAGFMRDLRRYAIERHGRESDQYATVKEAFGQAMSLMLGSWADDGTVTKVWKCKARRPDWTQHIQAQASATLWRWADDVHAVDPEAPVSLRNVDELVIPESMLDAVTTTSRPGGRPPMVIDPDGTQLGTFKLKTIEEWSHA